MLTVFQEIFTAGAGFKTGDFVKEKGVGGGDTVERLPPKKTKSAPLAVAWGGPRSRRRFA